MSGLDKLVPVLTSANHHVCAENMQAYLLTVDLWSVVGGYTFIPTDLHATYAAAVAAKSRQEGLLIRCTSVGTYGS